jgi:hypothetical protein
MPNPKVEAYFAGLPKKNQAVATALRQRIEMVVPDAVPATRMGVLIYTIGKKVYAGIDAADGPVSVLLPGTRGAFLEELGGDTYLVGSTTFRYRAIKRPAEIPRELDAWLKRSAAMARGEAGLSAKATTNVGARDYRAVAARFKKELKAVAPEILAWWQARAGRTPKKSMDAPRAKSNDFEQRWMLGPAGHPRIIAIFRRHLLEVDRLNQESDDPRRPVALLIDDLEASAPELHQLVAGMVLVPFEVAPKRTATPTKKARSFPILHDVGRNRSALLAAPADVDGARLGHDVSRAKASAKQRALHARYLADFARIYDAAVDFFEGPIEGRVREYGMSREAAIEDAYDTYFAGPAAAPELVWLVRRYWLAFDALNRTLPEAQRVAPQVALLGWLSDAPPGYTRMLTCLPYWPIGLDADGRWC